MASGVSNLEAALDYSFHDRALLERALTHKSRSNEQNVEGVGNDNEQLEFLGDSILGFVVSELLVQLHPDYAEGRLSKLKAWLVSASHLHEVAQKMDLGNHLLLGRGEEMSGGRQKRALLADALEALIAAVYLDGGIDPVRRLVRDCVIAGFELPPEGENALDYKSALQEMAQALKLPQPRYAIIEERGPEHAKTFTVEVRVGPDWTSSAEGLSKKMAGQQAARKVLQQLTDWGG